MLPKELIRKIKDIQIRSKRAVDTMASGMYRSVFRGAGIEFEEVREYTPGDEIKSIDWKVTARMGKPYIKRYREERELRIMLLVDVSASGAFGTTNKLKLEAALELASILAFLAIRNNDKVGAILFTDRVERHIPPKKGGAHVWRVIREILDFTPERRGTDVARAVDFLSKVSRKQSVAFVISDFYDQDFLDPMKRAARRHDVIAAHITDPGDTLLPEAGILEGLDLESGRHVRLDCSDKGVRKRWRDTQTRRREQTLAGFKSARIDCLQLSTQGSPADVLQGFFRSREKRFR